ncbi:killer cell lectin-like receptor subfamily B member 1B allele B [Emydura macquarii macquarii]|uniref:killer cell lectin-like receptor subfamily B member 1B allele B n=1 Tax=Emydura macquarii macquarii TaxID=1129001 RepID=UPI00352A9436
MASQVTYTDVKFLPRERACMAPPTSNTGDTITYAELRVHRKSERTSRSETSRAGPGSQCSGWFYVALVLGLIVLVLLAVIITFFWRENTKSLSKLSTTCTENTTSSGEMPCTGRCSATMSGLMKDLCEDEQGGTECLLCPLQWMLHKGRCYYFSEQQGTWNASVQNCLGRKSQLLVVDEAEKQFIENRTENKYFWIGLKFQEKEKRWMWLNDSQLEEHWLSSNVANGSEICAAFKKERFHPEKCQNSHKWICKKNATLLAPGNTAEH